VHTSAGQAWADGVGVCQDFSHNTLSLLRAAGIPARYVSGYIHTEEAEIGVPGVGESHAWVEVWNGAWEAHDPTNGRPVGAAHVLVARGRDYRDVSPLTGIYAGPMSRDPEVVVEVTRLER
jgi:transglutaminase-like putative cysteine protease